MYDVPTFSPYILKVFLNHPVIDVVFDKLYYFLLSHSTNKSFKSGIVIRDTSLYTLCHEYLFWGGCYLCKMEKFCNSGLDAAFVLKCHVLVAKSRLWHQVDTPCTSLFPWRDPIFYTLLVVTISLPILFIPRRLAR
ncbi:hypothetical protein BDW69DRAFT_177191 [Aspergillus filifer]